MDIVTCDQLRAVAQTEHTAAGVSTTPHPRSASDSSKKKQAIAQKYIAKMPDAVSGNGGHNKTFAAAAACFHLGLSPIEAHAPMQWFNTHKTGGQPWTEAELQHKLEDAYQKVVAAGEFGKLLKRNIKAMPTASGSDTETAELQSDLGNAFRLKLRYGDRIRFCYQTGYWLVWNGQRWCPDDNGQVERFAKDVARSILFEAAERESEELAQHAIRSQRRERIAAMIALAKSELSVRVSELDADPWKLNVENGTLDLLSGQLLPHNKADLITKIAPVVYDADAACPLWIQLTERQFAGNQALIQFVQRLEGMTLTGNIDDQVFPICYGLGANGKNVRYDTLGGLLGDYYCEAPPNLLTVSKHQEHPTELAYLMGRRLVVASETEEGAKLRLQLVKRLTGNRTIVARYMRQDYFEFARTFKLLLITNNRPVVEEDTEATWRRLRLIPFDVTIPPEERDPELTSKLRREWPGILAWLVRGCLDWRRHGLGEPDAVRAATLTYRCESDQLGQFLDECCDLGAQNWVQSGSLRTAYEKWCSGCGLRPLAGKAFTERLKAHGLTPERKQGIRGWSGVEVRP